MQIVVLKENGLFASATQTGLSLLGMRRFCPICTAKEYFRMEIKYKLLFVLVERKTSWK